MFNLPVTTDVQKVINKKTIFEHLNLSTSDRKLFDEQIAKITIVSEISPKTVNIAITENDPFIFILLIQLKSQNCDKRNIDLLAKVINQRLLFALQYRDEMYFAAKRADRVLFSKRQSLNKWDLRLEGLNLNYIWNQLTIDIFDISIRKGKTIDESILLNEQRSKLQEQINRLDKKARIESQPRRKREFVEEVRKLQKQLEEIGNE